MTDDRTTPNPTGGGRYEVELPGGGQLSIIRHDGDNSTVTLRQANGDVVRFGALPVILPYLEVNGASVPLQFSREEVSEFNRFIGGITSDGTVDPFEGLQAAARIGKLVSDGTGQSR